MQHPALDQMLGEFGGIPVPRLVVHVCDTIEGTHPDIVAQHGTAITSGGGTTTRGGL